LEENSEKDRGKVARKYKVVTSKNRFLPINNPLLHPLYPSPSFPHSFPCGNWRGEREGKVRLGKDIIG